METYIYRDCYAYYENLLKKFHKKFNSKLLIAGKISHKKIAISKCQKPLVALLSPFFINEILDSDIRVKTIFEEEGEVSNLCEVKDVMNDSLFVSKTYVEPKKLDWEVAYIFKVYSIQGDKKKIDSHWV